MSCTTLCCITFCGGALNRKKSCFWKKRRSAKRTAAKQCLNGCVFFTAAFSASSSSDRVYRMVQKWEPLAFPRAATGECRAMPKQPHGLSGWKHLHKSHRTKKPNILLTTSDKSFKVLTIKSLIKEKRYAGRE